jgi:glutathione synthase/RimK-type ligase-like ATP-grasp enzyme
MPILVVGDLQELSVVYITWLARRRGIPVIELAEEALGIDWVFKFDDQRRGESCVEVGDTRYSLGEFNGTFVRLNPHPALPTGIQLDSLKDQLFITERRAGLHHFLESLPCLVANRPSSGRSNGSKPHQMRLLAAAGFTVPSWMVSNDPASVDEFTHGCSDGFIYKSCSGLRSQVRYLDIDVLQKLHEGTTPIVVQEYIPGKDVRVHTIKRMVFSTEISGSAVDYRFEREGSKYRPTSVPEFIAELCCRVAEQEGLVIAGFDFRVTQDQQWYCLEVNPVPNFLPYEMSTGQPIGNAVIDVLSEHECEIATR